MSVSAILPSTTLNQAYNLQTPNQRQRTELQQLTQALLSGDLSSAQQAFGALTNQASNSGLLSQALSKLGSALQSGNLAGARQAYSSVQQHLQSSPPMAAHHHRPHHGGSVLNSLLSGLSDSISGSSAASQSGAFQPVNLTA